MTTPRAGSGSPGRVLAYREVARRRQGFGPDHDADLASLPMLGAAIRRRALLCATTAVLGMLLGVGLYVAAPPPPSAATSVLLTQNPTVNPVDTAQTDVELAQTRSVAGPVLRRLALHESVGEFIASYSVVPVTDRVLVFTTYAPSSAQAVRRAAALAAQFLGFRAHVLLTQLQLETASLTPKIRLARRRVAVVAAATSSALAQRASPQRRSALRQLRPQRAKARVALVGLLAQEAGAQATTAGMIAGSGVLDAAAPIPKSRRIPVTYAIDGLIAGLAAGMGFVLIDALTTYRPRRRADVALALGAPVRLSVRRPQGRWPRGLAAAIRWPRGLAAARTTDMQKIVRYLRGVVAQAQARPGEPATLAVVAVRNSRIAALSVASLALSLARDDKQVLVADLSAGCPAARLLGISSRGVRIVTVGGMQVLVAVPDRADIAPAGPIATSWLTARPSVSQPLADAYDSADVLLTLVDPNPALGTEHLASWAARAVVMLGAGQSSAATINAVGEAIRFAGTELVSAVLLRADRSDETLGTAMAPVPRRRQLPVSSLRAVSL